MSLKWLSLKINSSPTSVEILIVSKKLKNSSKLKKSHWKRPPKMWVNVSTNPVSHSIANPSRTALTEKNLCRRLRQSTTILTNKMKKFGIIFNLRRQQWRTSISCGLKITWKAKYRRRPSWQALKNVCGRIIKQRWRGEEDNWRK